MNDTVNLSTPLTVGAVPRSQLRQGPLPVGRSRLPNRRITFAPRLAQRQLCDVRLVSDREALLSLLPSRGIVCEVSVWAADYSRKILDIARPRQLHLIDLEYNRFQWPLFEADIAAGRVVIHQADSAKGRIPTHAARLTICRVIPNGSARVTADCCERRSVPPGGGSSRRWFMTAAGVPAPAIISS